MGEMVDLDVNAVCLGRCSIRLHEKQRLLWHNFLEDGHVELNQHDGFQCGEHFGFAAWIINLSALSALQNDCSEGQLQIVCPVMPCE